MPPVRAVLIVAVAAALPGAVVEVEITERSRFADGQTFGSVGAYQRLKGTVRFAVDPQHRPNRGIADISSAERDSDGQVNFSADLLVLQPADLSKGNRTILFDVVNRGKRAGRSVLCSSGCRLGSLRTRSRRHPFTPDSETTALCRWTRTDFHLVFAQE